MKKLLFLSSILPMMACLDTVKEIEDSGDPEADSNVEDCTDEIDNDEDGYTDCEDQDCFDDASCSEDTATDTGEVIEPTASATVNWTESFVSLTFAVENGSAEAEYYWGISETSDCGDCWTGEDCHNGYEINSGVLSYCHPLADGDATLLEYGGDPENLREGSTTVFNTANGDYENTTTHIIDDRGSANGPCWVWGADTSYYDDYEKSCSEM